MNYTQKVYIKAKPFYYKTDGSGRDTYIHHTNGGLLTQDLLHKLKLKPIQQDPKFKFGSRHEHAGSRNKQDIPRITHYQSDGSGRDLYIKVNEGGAVFNGGACQSHVDYQFSSSLRQY